MHVTESAPAQSSKLGSRRRSVRSKAHEPRRAVLPAVLLAAATVPPLCLSGNPPSATLLTALLAAAAALVAILEHGVPWRRPPPLLGLAIAALAWTALGIVPIPASWLRGLTHGSAAPLALEHAEVTSRLLGRPDPTWVAWSTSPVDTRHALVTGAAVLAMLLAASIAVAHEHRRALLRAVAASTIVMALVVLGHVVAGTHRVYGMIDTELPMTLASPLVNENRLAGFLALGAPICLALALSAQDRTRTLAWLGGAALTAATCVAAVSRGGLVGLVVAIGCFVALAARRKSGDRSQRVLLGGLAIVAVALGLVGYALYEVISRDVEHTTLYKVHLALRGLDLVARSPWVGVGRGGYSAAFVQLFGSDERHDFPESFPVQWAAEWGLPFAIGMAGTLGLLTLRSLRSSPSIERIGALAALLGLAVHELVDFATESPGVLVVASLVAVAALYDRPRAKPAAATRTPWLAVPALTLLVVLVPGLGLLGTDRHDRRVAIEASIAARDWSAADAQTRAALAERPGEPIFLLLGASARMMRGDADALAWLNASMLMAPRWPSPHLVAAAWLARRGRIGQAWLELREAERRQRGVAVASACPLMRSRRSAEDAIRLMSSEPEGTHYLELVAQRCQSADPTALAALDDALVEAGAPMARRRAASRALAARDPETALRLLADLPDEEIANAVIHADALVAAGRADEALAILRGVHPTGADRAAALRSLARAQAGAGDAEGMRQTIDQLLGVAGGHAAAVADAHVLRGDLEAGLDNRDEAYAAYDRADAIDPTRDGMTRALQLAGRVGDTYRAASLRRRLCVRSPSDSSCSRPASGAAP